MNKIFKLSLTLFVIVAGTLLLMAGAGGVRYVGNFTGNGAGLTNIPQAGVVQLSNSLYYLTNSIVASVGTNLSNLTVTNGARMTNVATLGLTNYGNLGTYNLHFWDPTQTTWTRLFVDDFTFNFSGLSVSNALFYGDGAGLTSLNGSQITSGTVADARIASTIARDSEVTTATQNSTNAGNIAFLPADNVFTGTSNHFDGAVEAAGFYGDGSGLTNVPGATSLFTTNGGVLSFPGTNGVETYQVGPDSVAVGYGNNGGAPHNILFSDSSDTGTELRDPHETNAVLRLDTDGTVKVTAGTFIATPSSLTGSGAGLTDVNLLNALSVGVTGDGATDDTAALQAAFDITTNGIYLPPGTYLITNTLVLRGFPHIVGAGIQKTFIKAGAGGADTGLEGGNMIQLATDTVSDGAMNGGLLRDFSLDGSGIAANGVVVGGATLYTNATGHMEDMEIKWCTNAGVLVLASQEFHIMNSSLSYNYHGIYSTTNVDASGNHSTTLYVDHCKIQANTNCGVYLNYAAEFRFRDSVIQGSGGPGIWFNHGGNLNSWAFVDVLIDGCYFEQNNITDAYKQVGQIRMDTHTTYPADNIRIKNNVFISNLSGLTTNFIHFGPCYATVQDNHFSPAWGCLTVSNATTVNIMGSSVNTGNTGQTNEIAVGLAGPDVYFLNSTTPLPANPNISWTYMGQTNDTEKTISPKRHSVYVNNGDGHLVPASMLFGSTTGAGATAWFPSVIATNLSVSGTMSIGTLIVTNPPVLDLQSSTNLFEKNVVVQTNTWGNQVVDFSRGTLLHTNMAGDLTLTGISNFALSNFNWMTVELNPNGATRVLTVPADWYVNIGTTITNGFTNATVGAIPDGTWAQLQLSAIIGVRTAAVLNILQ